MTRFHIWASVALTVLAFAATVALYPSIPDVIPVHWNIHGEVDDYGSKVWAVFLIPAIMAAMLAMFPALDWISPQHFKIDSFRSTYYFVLLVLTATMGYIQILILWGAVSGPVDFTRAMIAGLCLFIVMLGNVLGKIRRNFWVGVRTPWTIASERVWNETHRLAARLLVAAGVASFLIALFIPSRAAAVIAMIATLMFAGLAPVVYSLVLYKRLERSGELDLSDL
jgi:uncharacterized membrane protein